VPAPSFSPQPTGALPPQTSGSGPIRVPPLLPAKAAEYAGLFEKSGAVHGVLSGTSRPHPLPGLVRRLTADRRECKGNLRKGPPAQRGPRPHMEPLGYRAARRSQRHRVHHRHAHAGIVPDGQPQSPADGTAPGSVRGRLAPRTTPAATRAARAVGLGASQIQRPVKCSPNTEPARKTAVWSNASFCASDGKRLAH